MDKLKKLFGKKDGGASSGSASGSSSSKPGVATGQSTGSGDNAEGVVLHTTLGDITIALYKDQVPRTCKNFATLAATGKYDNVVFHRIISGFMIQGGDPTGTVSSCIRRRCWKNA